MKSLPTMQACFWLLACATLFAALVNALSVCRAHEPVNFSADCGIDCEVRLTSGLSKDIDFDRSQAVGPQVAEIKRVKNYEPAGTPFDEVRRNDSEDPSRDFTEQTSVSPKRALGSVVFVGESLVPFLANPSPTTVIDDLPRTGSEDPSRDFTGQTSVSGKRVLGSVVFVGESLVPFLANPSPTTAIDDLPRTGSEDPSRDFTEQTSVSPKRALGSVVFVGESLVPFLANPSPTTAIDDLPRTGSEDPSRDFTEQTSVSPKRALGSVVVVGESLMPSLKTPLSPEVVKDVAQRVEYPQHAVSARQNPVFKAELCELESRLSQEISGIIEQLTLDIDGVKRMLGRVEDTVSTKDMGEEVNQRLGRIEESFLKVSDLVRYSDSTTPEIESLEAHFTQLREQVASAQAELRRNNQGVVEIGGAFGSRLDELEGILQQVITKWESDQSEMAQRLSHLQSFQPDQLKDFNERLGRIEESFVKVSDQVRHIDSTTPEIEGLEAHFTQLREQVASAQAELNRNSQGVVEIGGAFGSRLDDLEGILHEVIAKWESDQSEMAQRLSHQQGFQPDQLKDFNERLGRIEESFLKVSDQVRHIDSTTPEIESLEAHFTQLREQVASAQAELRRNSQGVVEIGGAFGSRLDDLEGILHEVIAKWESDQSEMAQRLSHLQSFQPDQLKDFNERLGRIEESFLKVSDQVRHIDSTTPEIEGLEAHFTQLREQVASAQAELNRNSQGVVEIGGAFGSRLDDLEGILHEVIAKWESDQSEMAQRLSHLQGFQPDQLKDFNERLGRIEESFLKVSDQVRHIDSTTPEIESLEAHFTQLREQVASAQAELRRNSQGVVEIGGAFDELEGILHEVIAKWESDQSEMAQRLSHLQGFQPDQLKDFNERLGRIEESFLKVSDQVRHIDSTIPEIESLEAHFTQLREQVASAQAELRRNSQGVVEIGGAFGSRLDDLEGILHEVIAKWESDQSEIAQRLSHLQGFQPDQLKDFNERLGRIEESFLKVSDQVRHIDSTIPEIESLEAHFTQLREQVASAQAELRRNSQGVVEIGGAFGSRLDELEGILQQVVAKWESDQSEIAQRLSHQQGFQPDQLKDFNERLGRIEESFLKVSDQVRHIDSTIPEIESLEAHFTQLREQVASAQAELRRNNQGVVEIGGAFGSRLDDLEGILHEVIAKWESDQSEMAQRLSHQQGFQPDQLKDFNERLGRIEESFLKVSDQVRHIDSTIPEIESLEAHFTQLREQVASAQAELRRNNQGVVEIGGAFGSRLDELEGILQQVIAKWESDQSEMAQRLSHQQGFQPDQLKDFNERLGRIEESFLKVSDQVRHIDSTTPETESLEAHFTQLREQVASAQAELRRNSQGVAEIGGAFGSRLDDLEGILQQVITRWDSGDQLQTGQRIRHLPSVQPAPLTEHKQNSQEVTDLRDAFRSRLDELEGILQRGLAKWGSDQLELAQAINTLQGFHQDPLNDANFQQAGHLEPMKPVTVYAKQHPVFYRPNHFEKTFNGQPVAYWQSQVPPVNESENVLQMTILAFKSCVVGVLVTCMVVLGAMMFFVLQKKGHTS